MRRRVTAKKNTAGSGFPDLAGAGEPDDRRADVHGLQILVRIRKRGNRHPPHRRPPDLGDRRRPLRRERGLPQPLRPATEKKSPAKARSRRWALTTGRASSPATCGRAGRCCPPSTCNTARPARNSASAGRSRPPSCSARTYGTTSCSTRRTTMSWKPPRNSARTTSSSIHAGRTWRRISAPCGGWSARRNSKDQSLRN